MDVGPTLRVKRGDKVRIVLNNTLSNESVTAIGQYYTSHIAKNKTGDWFHDKDVYSFPNHTNLHLHGLHVSPLGDHDNVFRDAAPESSLVYEYEIPATHPTGTFWYHPHFHGSSSLQLASGMMGAFIVEDDPDEVPAHSALGRMEEVVIVVHEVAHSNTKPNRENILCYFCFDDFMWPSGDRLPLQKQLDLDRYPEFAKCGGKNFPGTKRDFFQMTQPLDCTYALLNGVYQPDIAVTGPPGTMQRWRLVQSSHQSTIRLSVDPLCETLVLARDGIYLDQARNITGLALVVPAGSRVDLGVRCPSPGRYNVTSLKGGLHNSTGIPGAKTLYEPVLWPRLLATIVVVQEKKGDSIVVQEKIGEGDDGEELRPVIIGADAVGDAGAVNFLPPTRPNLLDAEVARSYKVIYNMTGYGTEKKSWMPHFIGQFLNGGLFSINGKSFTNRTEHCLVRGEVEEWTIVNAASLLDRWMHSFHIHQNSFQIVSQDLGEPGQLIVERLQRGEWRDTVQIPVRGSVTFRINATDFIGKFPFHCHVTAHQGIGMMQLAEVVDTMDKCPLIRSPERTSSDIDDETLHRMAKLACPKWLGGVCNAVCIATGCGSELVSCMTDSACRNSLTSVNRCMKTGNASSPYFPDDCLTPDNVKRDNFLLCAIEKHRCMSPGKSPTYPACRDSEAPSPLEGDASFKWSHLPGKWFKVHSWRLGEPVECMPCQSVRLLGEGDDPTVVPGTVTFDSYWNSPDVRGKWWNMSATAQLGPRTWNASAPPAKMFNTGVMFGLTFWENYTVVSDKSQEDVDPYLLFYVCGGTMNGNYTTAFALAKTPYLGDVGRASLAKDVASMGMKWTPDFCTVDNSCFQ
jgi:FtsP/CotA-like multicopper oxidase with cupredoxin domain